MTISQASEKYGLSADTLRYYEKIGLIPPVNRKESGIRDYNEKDCNWIEFIKCMRSAGLPVEVLIRYVGLFQQGNDTVAERKALLIEQRDNLQEQIKNMKNTLDRLNKKIENYDSLIISCESKLTKGE